jgi:hypothetical protein
MVLGKMEKLEIRLLGGFEVRLDGGAWSADFEEARRELALARGGGV